MPNCINKNLSEICSVHVVLAKSNSLSLLYQDQNNYRLTVLEIIFVSSAFQTITSATARDAGICPKAPSSRISPELIVQFYTANFVIQ